MITAVDTNVLLDVLTPGHDAAGSAAEQALEMGLSTGSLIICDAVYAELAVHFGDRSLLDKFLVDTGITLEYTPKDALVVAASAFREYLRRRGQGFSCPACGTVNHLACSSCGRTIRARQHPLSDFYIGAHAQACADSLLTRDRGIYRTYFPKLRVQTPP